MSLNQDSQIHVESTQTTKKDNWNSPFSFEETESASHNISRRYFNNSGLEGGNESNTEPVNISPAGTKFFDKYKEISSPVPTFARIWGVDMNLVGMTEISNYNSALNSFEEIICKDRELAQLGGRLSSTAVAVLLAPLLYCAIQRQQIMKLAKEGNYNPQIILTEEVKEELK